MSSNDQINSPLIETISESMEKTDQDKSDFLISKNVIEDPVNNTTEQRELNEPCETSSKTWTSSDLLYSEYVKSEKTEKICGMFESKKKKPLIQSYGESPLYQKYSALLKELQESKDECPIECGEDFPVVQIHCLVKQKTEDNSDDSDECEIEDSRLVFYDSKRESHSDEETSSDEEETVMENVAHS